MNTLEITQTKSKTEIVLNGQKLERVLDFQLKSSGGGSSELTVTLSIKALTVISN